MTIDATIQRLTNDGEIVVQFLVDVIQGTSYNAPLGHRIKSAEWLSALGGFIPEDAIPKSATEAAALARSSKAGANAANSENRPADVKSTVDTTEQRDADKQPATAAEKPDVSNTPSTNPGRAARRPKSRTTQNIRRCRQPKERKSQDNHGSNPKTPAAEDAIVYYEPIPLKK